MRALKSTDEVDRCVYNDDEIRAQILSYEQFVAKALALLPDEPSPEEHAAITATIKKIDQVQAELQLLRARVDFCDFAELVITDDETGQPIKQAPIHRRWAELADEHKQLIVWSHRASGKTTQFSIARTVWELGRDPTLRFLILSNTAEIAVRILKAIANLIKNSAMVKKVFPHLEPNSDGPWTNTQLQVVRVSDSKDPSVRASGIHGAVTSARIDRVIVDDILDFEGVSTDKERKKTMAWYKATVPGCLTRRARVTIVGTAYHPSDFIHEMAKVKGYRWFRFPLIATDGTITWPELWTPQRIESLKEELGPLEWARQALCKARSDEESRFHQDWIDTALAKGRNVPWVNSIDEIPEEERVGTKVFTGVDLSTGKKKKKTDQTAFFTYLQYPNGMRRLLWLQSGKFNGPEIIKRVLENHERYESMIAVEDNGAQSYLLDFTRESSSIPIFPHTTTKAKRDPILGVEGLALELASGRWIFPNDEGRLHPELAQFIEDLLFFDPTTHTADMLMACYFARELSRRLYGRASFGPVAVARVIGEAHENKPAEATEVYREGVSLKALFDVPSDIPAPPR